MTIKELDKCIYNAIIKNKKFIGFVIKADYSNDKEIHIIPISNITDKLAFIYNNYDHDNLTNTILKDRKIDDCIFGDSFSELQSKMR